MDTAPTDVDLLREEISALREEITLLQMQRPAQAVVGSSLDASATETPQGNRRNFLKLAGAAAAGATVVAVAGSARQAAAFTGGPVVIGDDSNADNVNETTRLINPSSTVLDDQTFRVDNYGNLASLIAIPANHRIAVAGTASGAGTDAGYRTGIYGRTAGPGTLGGQGVFGSAEGVENPYTGFSFGLVGTAEADGYGVFGYNPSGAGSVGVLGRADEGTGVIASSYTGLSLLVRDGGRMQQQLRATGAPTTGTFSAGEQIRDGLADLYICTNSGTPGTWRKVTAQHPDYANAGGSLNLLPRPIRLLDTRPTTSAPLTNGHTKISTSPITLQITGTVADSLSVPAGAKGILGNVTISGAVGAGYALVWSNDQPTPGTSNINFGAADVANYFISAIDATGKLKVMSSLPANMLLDVFGFVF